LEHEILKKGTVKARHFQTTEAWLSPGSLIGFSGISFYQEWSPQATLNQKFMLKKASRGA